MTQVRPAPPPHTRSLAACVQTEICRSRVRGPDQLRVLWMRVTIMLKISSQKAEFTLLITFSSAHNTRARTHTAADLCTRRPCCASIYKTCVGARKGAKEQRERGGCEERMGARLTLLRSYVAAGCSATRSRYRFLPM